MRGGLISETAECLNFSRMDVLLARDRQQRYTASGGSLFLVDCFSVYGIHAVLFSFQHAGARLWDVFLSL